MLGPLCVASSGRVRVAEPACARQGGLLAAAMDELVSSLVTATGTFCLGAAGAYKFAQLPRGPAPTPPAPREGEVPRVVEVRVRCERADPRHIAARLPLNPALALPAILQVGRSLTTSRS